jgi:glycosyltransferase involved in cell wall biosynthesis
MKLLFVSCTLPPEGSAVGVIVDHLAEALVKRGHVVDGLGVKTSLYEKSCVQTDYMEIFRVNHILSKSAKNKKFMDMAYILMHRLKNKIQKPSTTIYREEIVRAFERKLEQIFDRYDAIIAVCAYYDAMEAVLRVQRKHEGGPKCILYQVDPLSENEIYAQETIIDVANYEKEIYRNCYAVLTTPLIYALKNNKADAKEWNINHVVSTEFPGLVETDSNVSIQKNKNEIRCVFAGYLYGTIRDARFTLELFSKLQDQRIQLYIIGSGQEELLQQYAQGALAGKLHCLGQLPSEVCNAWLASADVLVNIGNSASNQVPSKLFTYLSYGKTILNVMMQKNCPTKPYMDRYPLAINIEHTANVDDMVPQVETAILSQLHQRLPLKAVQNLFPQCTPDYVAEQLLDSIEL